MEPAFGSYTPTPTQQRLIDLVRNSFLRRGSFRPLMARTVNALRDGPLDMHFMNTPFRLRPLRSAVDLGMTFNADYNGTEIRFLLQAIPDNGVFVDVGCNIGMYSLSIAHEIAPRNGRVIGLEPHPEARAYLEFNIAAARLTNFTLVTTAAGDFTGEAKIETNAENLGGSGIAEDGDIPISVRPLLDILRDQSVTRIDALKIDVEGYEDRALMPFFETAPDTLWPKALVLEYSERESWLRDLLGHLQTIGYHEAGRTRSNMLLNR